MNIKPGMLCYIVKSNDYPEYVGRIVQALERSQQAERVYSGIWWLTSHQFFVDGENTSHIRQECLRPIHDPDADLTETHDEELTV